MVTDPMKKMKAGLKEKVNRMLYFFMDIQTRPENR